MQYFTKTAMIKIKKFLLLYIITGDLTFHPMFLRHRRGASAPRKMQGGLTHSQSTQCFGTHTEQYTKGEETKTH